jgi:hypothetical protein
VTISDHRVRANLMGSRRSRCASPSGGSRLRGAPSGSLAAPWRSFSVRSAISRGRGSSFGLRVLISISGPRLLLFSPNFLCNRVPLPLLSQPSDSLPPKTLIIRHTVLSSLSRQDHPPSAQPRRRPPSQQRPVGHHPDPTPHRSRYPRLRPATHRSGQDPQGDHALLKRCLVRELFPRGGSRWTGC